MLLQTQSGAGVVRLLSFTYDLLSAGSTRAPDCTVPTILAPKGHLRTSFCFTIWLERSRDVLWANQPTNQPTLLYFITSILTLFYYLAGTESGCSVG